MSTLTKSTEKKKSPKKTLRKNLLCFVTLVMQSYAWGGANVNQRENINKNVTATYILECFMHMKNEEPVGNKCELQRTLLDTLK